MDQADPQARLRVRICSSFPVQRLFDEFEELDACDDEDSLPIVINISTIMAWIGCVCNGNQVNGTLLIANQNETTMLSHYKNATFIYVRKHNLIYLINVLF